MCLIIVSVPVSAVEESSVEPSGGGGGSYHRGRDYELTDTMRYWIAAFALAQGITFVNPLDSDAIQDFYDSLSYTDKQAIIDCDTNTSLKDFVWDYNIFVQPTKAQVESLVNNLAQFFTHEKYFSSVGSVDYGQSVSFSGTSINLSLADQIVLTTQSAADPDPGNKDCHVDYKIAGFTLRQYYHSYYMPTDVFPDSSASSIYNYVFLKPDSGDLCFRHDVQFGNSAIYSNLAFDYTNLVLRFQKHGNSSTVGFSFNGGNRFYSISNRCYYVLYTDSRGTFFSNNGVAYNNLFFADNVAALNYFFGQGGISIDSSFEVHEVSSTPDVIEIDEDKQTTFVNNFNAMSDDDVISIVIPTSNTYNTFVNNPDLLFDFSQDNLYDSSLTLPATDGNKWANKFPFCLPFDIYHLFSNFSAEPEAPELHMLVLPANSFGFSNDAFYIDFDFADYNILVQILRFFIALGFVIWLIVITNKLIK